MWNYMVNYADKSANPTFAHETESKLIWCQLFHRQTDKTFKLSVPLHIRFVKKLIWSENHCISKKRMLQQQRLKRLQKSPAVLENLKTLILKFSDHRYLNVL